VETGKSCLLSYPQSYMLIPLKNTRQSAAGQCYDKILHFYSRQLLTLQGYNYRKSCPTVKSIKLTIYRNGKANINTLLPIKKGYECLFSQPFGFLNINFNSLIPLTSSLQRLRSPEYRQAVYDSIRRQARSLDMDKSDFRQYPKH